MAVMAYFAYSFWCQNKTELAVAAGATALLFQPFVKIALGRTMWNVVDVLLAAALLVYWWKNGDKKT